jgi:two-component system nitrate/nitrite response regulator NarL
MTPSAFLIIEDHPIFRQALVAMLDTAFPNSSFSTSGTLSEGKKILERAKPAPIVILDVNLPDSQGTDGALELLRLSPGLKIIALSADDSAHRRSRLLKLGVHGFLSKTISSELFINRLNELIREERRDSAAAADALEESPFATGQLSSRQRAVMLEMARGRSNKEIALSLDIGVETVKTHVSEIIRRFGVRNRAEAIRYFLDRETSGR